MRIRTISLIVTLVIVLLAAPLPVDAQQAEKIPRIGFLSFFSPLHIDEGLVCASEVVAICCPLIGFSLVRCVLLGKQSSLMR